MNSWSPPTITTERLVIRPMTVGDLKLADFGVEELVPFLKAHDL